jgi:hypothetical protein
MIIFIEDNIFNQFVRWGDLDSYKRQITNIFNLKSSDNVDSYHVAPAKRGFYAFPLKFIEPYLIGSTEQTQGKPFQKLKYHKFKLSDDKLIWSHFVDSIPRNEIEKISGDWALSTVKSWKKGLTVAIAKTTNSDWDFNYIYGGRAKYPTIAKFNHSKYNFDAFEVFIPSGTLK